MDDQDGLSTVRDHRNRYLPEVGRPLGQPGRTYSAFCRPLPDLSVPRDVRRFPYPQLGAVGLHAHNDPLLESPHHEGMQMRDRGFSQRDDHQGYVRQTRYGDESVDLWAHINAAGPPAQRALGDEEVKLLRLVVQDALALEAGSHSPADVARLIRRLDDPAGVVGGLQQARHHHRLEGRDTPGLLLQLSDLLLLTGQAQAMQDAPAGGTGCQLFEQGGEFAELL